MNQHLFKGILFLNNLNLCSNKRKPLGRVDENFELTVFNKLKYVADYAKSNELKVIMFGDTFKSFESESILMIIDAFSGVSPLIIDAKKSRSCEFLKRTNMFEVVGDDGEVLNLNIEGDSEEITEYIIEFFDKVDKSYTGLELNNLDMETRGIVISNNYVESEMKFDSIDAVICGKWESISTSVDQYKFVAPSIIRDDIKDKDSTPSVLVWKPETGLDVINIPHEKVVFDDFDFSDRMVEGKTSEFAEKLRISSSLNLDNDDLSVMIESMRDSHIYSSETCDELCKLYNQVKENNNLIV